MIHYIVKCRNCFATVTQCRCIEKHEVRWVDGCSRCADSMIGGGAHVKPPPPPPPPPKPEKPTVAVATDEQIAAALGVTPELARELRERLAVIRSVIRVHGRPFSPMRVSALSDANELFERILAHVVESNPG